MRVLVVEREKLREEDIDDERRIGLIDQIVGARVNRAAPLLLSHEAICIWSVDATELNGLASKLTGHLVYGTAVIAENSPTRITGLRQDYINALMREVENNA